MCRNVWQNCHFWPKLSLAGCGTFLFSKFVCIWLLILQARIQFLKESRVVAMESCSIQLIEVIVHNCSKKRCFRNIGGTYKKTPTAKYNFRYYGVIWLICPQTSKPKILYKNCAFGVLDVHKCGALRDMVPLVQFKKRVKHPWRSVNFSKVAG